MSFIKDRRIELGMTLQEVADMVGVSKPCVCRWESGDIDMKRDKIPLMAKALKCSELDILGYKPASEVEQEQADVKEYLQAIHDNPDIKVLFQASKNATPEKLNAVIALLNK